MLVGSGYLSEVTTAFKTAPETLAPKMREAMENKTYVSKLVSIV